MAAVALPLHRALLEQQAASSLICGSPPEQKYESVYVAGQGGRGFGALPAYLFSGLVHIHGLWTPFEWFAHRQAQKHRARLVVSPHGALAPWALAQKRIKKCVAWHVYQRRMIECADLLIASSEQEHLQLRGLGLLSPIAIIPNGVEEDSTRLAESGRVEREKIVLFLARLSPAKGVADLLQAWSGLEDRRGYELHIHGFGDPRYREFLKTQIQTLGLLRDVKLLGPLYGDQKWQKLRSCSVYVLPSYGENFGISVAEALRAGLPVITSRATPWGHLVERRLGWVVDNDVGQLRQALREAISLTLTQAQSIGERAREYALQNFSWPGIAEQYAKTYAWVRCPTSRKPDWISIP
ncbi:glycosyltransferase [Bradyrhizobium sp. BRP22]|uniref:glycosyltransferase n=1 Tax=Bradyrhizobium sp. BRP22 TaxID=2793821 RepID=UPI001CD64432|nr:glycosyltransferase [Bradyrhizobium sp. BRP22]MCA1452086.1 glycosyltransferase [Bradyrhizobium sp. BRP22]